MALNYLRFLSIEKLNKPNTSIHEGCVFDCSHVTVFHSKHGIWGEVSKLAQDWLISRSEHRQQDGLQRWRQSCRWSFEVEKEWILTHKRGRQVRQSLGRVFFFFFNLTMGNSTRAVYA